ncbi:MAG: BamA/TamA family outer membrane protein [Candidatus Latescibacterota bacterium]|nr:BamA/TamA family outer membrane protein [Candidatus Latescibacterota bacterium]
MARLTRVLSAALVGFLMVAIGPEVAAALPESPAAIDSTAVDSAKKSSRQIFGLTGTGAARGQTVAGARWVSRRRQFSFRDVDYGFTGLPVIYYAPKTGWNYGGRVQFSDFRRRPYRYKVTVHWIKSSAGKRSTHIRLKVPYISGTGFGLRLLVSDTKDISARYYGLSNDSERETAFTTENSAHFIDEHYYNYVLEAPRVILSLLRNLYGPLSMSVGFGLERTEVAKRGQVAFYAMGTPDGVVDGVTGFVSATLQWDTRDDPVIPRQGTFHEWSYETSRNSVLGLLFEEIDFQRTTITDSRYVRLDDRLELAHRTIFEALKGSVPLYAYGELGGSRRIKALGGSDTLRGFDRQRFTDNIRFLTNTELRYHLGFRHAFRQNFEFLIAGFLDSGQVAPGMGDLGVQETHLTAGLGLRCYWNEDFVLRFDLGVSPEQVYPTHKYRNVF